MTYNLSYLQYGATDFNLARLQLPAYSNSPMTWTFDWPRRLREMTQFCPFFAIEK
jgi:hypothetical protein